MAVDTSAIGASTGTTKVVVERGPVANFARAIKDDNPVYTNPEAARAAGLADIPAPPTFSFVMGSWGAFPDLQDEGAATGNKGLELLMKLRQEKGGLILHGEQEFIYHRPIVVGDVLVGEGRVSDIYERESGGKTMTFVVTDTDWKDAETGEPVVTARFNLILRS